jgi:hypothetical protein
VPALGALALLAALGLAWGCEHALATSKDLLYRWAEVARFVRREDPYQLPSMTYPPSALPVFTPLVAPFGREGVKAFWLGMNLAALAALGAAMVRLWGEAWPGWLKAAFVLAVVASKPVRGGIGLGQYHLVPTALMVLAVPALRGRRPIVAGLLVGVALAKPTMAVPFLFVLAVRAEWRALGAALAFQAAAWLGASAWLGIGPARLAGEWVDTARGQLAEGMIDLPSLAQKHWPGTPPPATPITLAVLALSFLLLLAYRRRSDLALVGVAAYAAAIATYHRPYDLVLLLPAMATTVDAAWQARGRRAPARWLAAGTFAALLIVPSNPSVTGRPEGGYDALFVVLAYAFLALAVYDLARGAGPEGSVAG